MISRLDMKYIACALPRDIESLRIVCDCENELVLIDEYFKKPLPEALKKRLEFEILFAERLMDNYIIDDNELLRRLRERYPDATHETIHELVEYGNVAHLWRDGVRYFEKGALANIYKTRTDFLEHLGDKDHKPAPVPDPDFTAHLEKMRRQGYRAFSYEIEHILRPQFGDKEWEELDGLPCRVWLPYPCECDTQTDIRLISSSHKVATEDVRMRAAYIETVYHAGEEFSVRYSYTCRADFNGIVGRELRYEDVSEAQPDIYLDELLPQIQFTPYLRALAWDIVGGETNPLRRAELIYRYITENIKYSYIQSYFTIPCIAEYVALNGHGDCGAMSLLFITLCRIVGVPAKWQSGNSVRPSGMGSHDWCMFYVAPFGWLYCDPSYGEGAYRAGNEEKRMYYFTNLDPFRCVTCNDFMLDFKHPMTCFGDDPYDNQNGELECEGASVSANAEKRVISAKEI